MLIAQTGKGNKGEKGNMMDVVTGIVGGLSVIVALYLFSVLLRGGDGR